MFVVIFAFSVTSYTATKSDVAKNVSPIVLSAVHLATLIERGRRNFRCTPRTASMFEKSVLVCSAEIMGCALEETLRSGFMINWRRGNVVSESQREEKRGGEMR